MGYGLQLLLSELFGKTWGVGWFQTKAETPNEQWKQGPWLFRVYGGWDTTQLYRDDNKPM